MRPARVADDVSGSLGSLTIAGMSTLWTRIASVAVVLCALTAVSSCGNEGDDTTAQDPTTSEASPEPSSEATTPSETASPHPSGFPECSTVWIDGQDLPSDYKACVSEGQVVKPTKRMCGFGVPLLEQENRFYAMRGKPINEVDDLTTDEAYQQLLAACQG